ncbi:alpha/beta hydrolase [Pseudogulbenkiania sp. MAI-1]|uniref:PHA/PHB synthase family protein n=1 Tax=Pseudogulbenkiania sp. MAI-1 TaxID=990370 RepID=UPI00045EAE36|nr:alpha/beta fold hydrolase [Pseudogulbenkiania sp. MAI-1]
MQHGFRYWTACCGPTESPPDHTAAELPAGQEPDETDTPNHLDRLLRARLARSTLSMAPASLMLAGLDWAIHLALSPAKCHQLGAKGLRNAIRLGRQFLRSSADGPAWDGLEPLQQDPRFSSHAWQRWPFNLIAQGFQLNQQWWHNATTGIAGVSRRHERMVAFTARQWLDMMSPVNFIATNPEALQTTLQQRGQNLLGGLSCLLEDWEHALGGKPPPGAEAFRPGHEVALTPGRVVYRNRLIELLQYTPQTEQVYPEPILIVPAWLMKYYILDLFPTNSLVNYLVGQGHTVFMISWHNPDSGDRDLGLEDYLQLGVLDALNAIHAIVPDTPVHATGYCLGGTLLALAAAYLAREHDASLASATLLAAQTDFAETGVLMQFIDDSQLSYLEDLMWEQGYLDTMNGALQLLRSCDLNWSRQVHHYLMGRRQPMNELVAWNADATRMPCRIHSEYLRRLFLDNDLAEGRYPIGGRPVVLRDIRLPLFVVATETDHVAPWHSVYQSHLLTHDDVHFLLASGGHNTGIVSEPGSDGSHYRSTHATNDTPYQAPETWFAATAPVVGSWWPAWAAWLQQHSGALTKPPALGAAERSYPPLEAAPGRYVLEC